MVKVSMRVLSVVGVLLVVGATGAGAQYGETPPSATINDTTVTPGQAVTVHFEGFDPNTSASGVLNSAPIPLGTKTTSATGSVDFTFDVPSSFAAGETHSVTATGTRAGVAFSQSVSFTVVAAAAPGGAVAVTGSSSSVPLSRIGIALLAVGGGAVYLARRRRSTAVA